MIMGGMKMKGKVRGRGAGNWGDEHSVKSCIIRGSGERLDANINRGV